uniref:Ig-like domain-containing protein n=1 Tax=Sander lucioperca TaxID=283035 RepID=A0A8C9XCK0_SANLU
GDVTAPLTCIYICGLVPPALAILLSALRPGDDVILPCQAADPSISFVEWTRPDLKPDIVLYSRGGHLETDDQHPSFKDRVELVDRELKDRDASLTLKNNVSRHDNGTYECRVKTNDTDQIRTISIIRLQVIDSGEVVSLSERDARSRSLSRRRLSKSMADSMRPSRVSGSSLGTQGKGRR